MSEQQQETEQQHETRDMVTDALADALVREVIGLAALGLVLLAIDPRVQMWIRDQVRRFRWITRDARKAAADQAVAQLQRDISEFEHKAARRKDGGCGCV
jgi:hypothetical protein